MIVYTPGGEDQDPKGFINNDQAADSSIGSGSSDQGIEPGYEDDDEFNHDITGLPDKPRVQDGDLNGPLGELNKEPGKTPTHGLVEEGPGPDA